MSAVRQGPIVSRLDGAGPPIECRGLNGELCQGVGTIQDGAAGVELAPVVRVIVSCHGAAPCTDAGGAFGIDVLLSSGETFEVARGGYGDSASP